MKYEITESQIQWNDGIKKYEVKYDGLPDKTIPLVVEAKESLLQEIELDDMLMNLNNSTDLLYIAFCALNGKDMQGDLDGLQASLLKLCGKSKATMTTFKDQSKEITRQILDSYKWMKKGMTSQALVVFDSTAQYAAQMAKTSKELSNEFDHLAEETVIVLKKVETEHASETKHKAELEEELVKMNAEKAKTESLAKSLTEEVETINVEYNQEKEALKAAESRELTMGIVSAITGALSLGISAGISAATKNNHVDTSQEELAKIEKEKAEKEKKKEETTKQKEEAKKKIDEINDQIKTLKNKKEAKETQLTEKKELLSKETNEELKEKQQKDIETLEKEIENITKQIQEQEKQIEEQNTKVTQYESVLTGIAASLQSLTESMKEAKNAARSASEAHANKVNSLLDKKLQLEKQKRESLADIEKFAILVQLNKDKVITTDTAIEMLLTAIRCLKKVSASLLTAALFWESLSQYCEKLSQSTISKLIESVSQLSKEERIEFFTDSDFIAVIVRYATQWAAMYYVSDDYLTQANIAYNKAHDNFEKMPDAKEAVRIAQEKSKIVLSNIQKQMRDSDATVIEIEKQKKIVQENKNESVL
ncbi:hypothetical protein [Candidatus Stoquefichus massiliensis]|uniref:hypothetical protein n=1 Tax=Candidatus Stoquefichus massiliensis TaxID=1470350 RepID=UPI0004B4BABE|nr:hypothetical protein [Candidatus Stoquefichus massiliensis]